LVGFSKLTLLTPPDAWWLEGLRVHPEFEGRGVARQLHEEQVHYWRERLGGTLRLATSAKRLPVQHLCEQTGFVKAGEFTYYGGLALEGGAPDFAPLQEGEIQAALAFAQASESLALSNGLMDLHWSWTEPAEVHLREAVEGGLAWWWRGPNGSGAESAQVGGWGGLLVVHSDPEADEALPSIGLAACRVSDLPELLMAYRRLAGQMGYTEAMWSAPLRSDVEAILGEAGFEREWDSSVFLYELRQGRG
jgi:hypothetical protein